VFGKNIPLTMLPDFFFQLTDKYLIIEFVPFEDEKVKILLQNKEQYHKDYTADIFEKLFSSYFNIVRKEAIGNTSRILYLMRIKNN
jgi:hypothetical protein